MPNPQITADIRLYHWLKPQNDPARRMENTVIRATRGKGAVFHEYGLTKIAESRRKTQQLIPLNEAEKLVDDVMNVRRCRLLDWEVEILEHLRKKDPPVSMFRLSMIFGVSEKNISDLCNSLELGTQRGIGNLLLGKFGHTDS